MASASDKELQEYLDLINGQINFLMKEKETIEAASAAGENKTTKEGDNITGPSRHVRLREYTHFNAFHDKPDFDYVKSITYSPKDILKYLNLYVTGQDSVKKAVSTCLFMHIVNLTMQEIDNNNPKSARSHLLIAGPTGTGKTYILSKAAEFMEVPFYKIDCSNLSQAGFAGFDINEHIEAYYKKFRDHPGVAYGIILLDEIDKITTVKSSSGDPNVNVHIQSNLLTLLEGNDQAICDSDRNNRISGHFNTRNLQFVFSGAFSHLNRHKPRVTKGLGFGTELETVEEHPPMTHEDLEKAGMMPELIGRIGRICETHAFTDEEIWNLINNCEDNALDHYIALFENCGKSLKLSKKEKQELFDKVKNSKTGARVLNQAIFELLEEKIYDLKFKVNYEG